jgi:hypothetical protein
MAWRGPGFGMPQPRYPYYAGYGEPYMYPPPYGPAPQPEDEKKMLKDEAQYLQEQLNSINERLSQLEEGQGDQE